MRETFRINRSGTSALIVAAALSIACGDAKGAITLIGTQYRPDKYFPEFDCYWNASAYPGSCRTPMLGSVVNVYFKNTGATAVTINDLNLTTAGGTYSLKKIIKKSTSTTINPKELNSIYFYWDNPPQDVLDAGEPAWYRFDPPSVPAGGVGRAAVRFRKIPLSSPVRLEVVTSGGNASVNVAVDANTPQVASIGYSDDLRKVYLHWRRSGGAGPATVWLDGVNVSAQTTTVSDPSLNFAASVISLPSPLTDFSYHVFQGVYGDGKTAAASQRAWTNKFIYASYSTFSVDSSYTASDWVEEASNHGFNNVQMNLGAMGSYLGTSSGRADCLAHDYGYTILDKTKLNALDPDMFFLNDEPDAEEYNQGNTHCGTGYKIPCDSAHYPGSLVIKTIAYGEGELRALRPTVPFTVNLDGAEEPESFFTWGPAVDILQTDNYFDIRLKDSYLKYPNRIPLFNNAKFSYAVARTCCAGAEPNPSNHLLYVNKDNDTGWPYPTPASKRFEVYYSLAGGSKGMGYWWLNPPEGLSKSEAAGQALWKEIGLAGNEIRLARPMIVISTPVELPITPGAHVWAHALASGTDTLILLVVNDDYYSDVSGCHYNSVSNATVTVTLPSWMQSWPAAFEISASGIGDVSAVPNGSQLQLNLGTLTLTKMIILTTDTAMRSRVQSQYNNVIRSQVCGFAPEKCVNITPTIVQQPSGQLAVLGGVAHMTLVPAGSSPLGYRWQKNNADLGEGGHYSGTAGITLTVSGADTNDAANYRCIVSNTYGSVTSSPAGLTVAAANTPPVITQQPAPQSALAGGTAMFTVGASGSGTLGYRWQKNTVNLSNGGHYSGSTTATLTITNVDDADAAGYRCVVTNAFGSTNSASAALTINYCVPSGVLDHGDMEDASAYTVCPDWTFYNAGQGNASFSKETTITHTGSASQKCRNSNGGAGSLLGVRQSFDANVGDAFTFEGWVNPVSNPGAGQQVAMVARWDGSNADPATGSGTWNISTGSKNVWTHLQNLAGNATATQVTLFLDSRRTASSQDLTAYWDDVVSYRAYVPPPPQVSTASGTALIVDVRPGCNLDNSSAEYAITVGGGAYSLGTHWIQANGTVGTTAAWQTDAAWGAKSVGDLTTGVAYTFKVQARYSSSRPQPTSLGASATGTPAGSLPPAIVQQPVAQNVCSGDTAQFSVAASGSGTITFRWQKNSAGLSDDGHYSGTTSTTLIVPEADASDAGTYVCVVTGEGGSTNSSPAALSLKAATAITGPPLSQNVRPGANAAFSVTATGEGTLAYQWQTNGVDISNGPHYGGCATATLTVMHAQSADEVSYRCQVTGLCGTAFSSEADLTLVSTNLGAVTLMAIPTLAGDSANDARAITADGQWVVGASGSHGFLYAAGSSNAVNVVSSDAAQATLLTGVGYRTSSSQAQLVISGLSSGGFGTWMTADGGATWGDLAGLSTGKKPTVPAANGLSAAGADLLYSVWTDEGTGGGDNWGLNIGQFSGSWPATVAWASKSAAKPDTLQMNCVSGNGRAAGWRQDGTTLIYANYVSDWPTASSPWSFNGLDGTTAGQALAISADGTIIFGISPKGAATGTTNYGYKAVFDTTFPGAADQLGIAQLPDFPDTAASTDLAVPYGCTPDGKYAVGMSYRGSERAVLWDTSPSNPAAWTVIDLTEVAAANGILDSFVRLTRAYSIGTDGSGVLVITGVGVDSSTPANTRAFLMTVAPPLAPIAFPPVLTTFGASVNGFTCSFLSLANQEITYYLDCTTTLTLPSDWTTVSSTPGTGGMTSLSDPNPVGPQRFYRVRIE